MTTPATGPRTMTGTMVAAASAVARPTDPVSCAIHQSTARLASPSACMERAWPLSTSQKSLIGARAPAAPRPPHPPLFAPSRSLFREEAVQGADDSLGPLHVDSAPRYIRIGTTVNVNALDTAWAHQPGTMEPPARRSLSQPISQPCTAGRSTTAAQTAGEGPDVSVAVPVSRTPWTAPNTSA